MNGKRHSLTARLLLSAAVLIFLALIGAGILTDLVLDRFMHRQIDQQLDSKIAELVSALRPLSGGKVALTGAHDGAPFDRPGSGWYWKVSGLPGTAASVSLGARVVPDVEPPPLPTPPVPPLSPSVMPPPPPPAASDALVDGDLLHLRVRKLSLAGRDITVVATAPQDAVTRPLHEAMTSVLLALLIAGVALILAIFLQIRVGLKPLARLRGDVADIRAGRANRIVEDQPDEVQPLVQEINKLVSENALGLERARKHVSNLAHGLKTPLANLALMMAARDPSSGAEMEGLVMAIQKRIRHHLGRARAAALGGPARNRTSIVPRLLDICQAMEKIHADRGIAWSISGDQNLAVACEPQDVDEMMGNLLDNAFVWAAARVRLIVRQDGGQVEIAIADDGKGISGAAMADMLQPGKRLDETVPGDGFGLPITHELAELYGGSLSLRCSDLGGLDAVVRLPAAV